MIIVGVAVKKREQNPESLVRSWLGKKKKSIKVTSRSWQSEI